MIEKNFQIKQRVVNETAPMTGIHSQNLFKLGHEKKYRKMALEPAQDGDSREIVKKKSHNIAMDLLSDSDTDLSECNYQTEQQIIDKYNKHVALSKTDKDCKTLD